MVNKISRHPNSFYGISAARAALVAGLSLLVMALSVPFAEFAIFPSIFTESPTDTLKNLLENKPQFTTAIFLHFVTLVFDIVVAWALFVLLRPVNVAFSLVTAWFRLLYTAMYLVALVNLVKILVLLQNQPLVASSDLAGPVSFYYDAFTTEWSLGLIIFALHLIVLGYLVFRAPYIPKIFGIFLLLAGIGYLIHTIGSFVNPALNLDFLFPTFFGELVFMGWLLIKGRKLKEDMVAAY